jgi:hypothetical protein
MNRKAKKKFADNVLATIRKTKSMYLQAGTDRHRFIRIWAVVVGKRVFIRSWSLKPRSWYTAFLQEPRGVFQVADKKIPVRATRTRSERLKDAIDRAYLEKYHSPTEISYARDLATSKSRATTTELAPL